MRKVINYVLVLACLCSTMGCIGKSEGEKAAEEVIHCINAGDMETAKKLLEKYSATLDDVQDLQDFRNTLEEAGLY